MGISIRSRIWLDKERGRRREARAATAAADLAAAAAFEAEFLDRDRAAAFLQISVHRLKRMMAAGTGPACVKKGDTKQSGVRWPLVELSQWKANPAAYIAARNAAASSE